MKNVAISSKSKSESVAHDDLIRAMSANREYTLDEVLDLMAGSPRTAVRDTLHALVAKGVIWRDAAATRVKFTLLEGESLREAVERKAAGSATPAWPRSSISGYDASHRQFRALCETTRR